MWARVCRCTEKCLARCHELVFWRMNLDVPSDQLNWTPTCWASRQMAAFCDLAQLFRTPPILNAMPLRRQGRALLALVVGLKVRFLWVPDVNKKNQGLAGSTTAGSWTCLCCRPTVGPAHSDYRTGLHRQADLRHLLCLPGQRRRSNSGLAMWALLEVTGLRCFALQTDRQGCGHSKTGAFSILTLLIGGQSFMCSWSSYLSDTIYDLIEFGPGIQKFMRSPKISWVFC